MRIAVVGPGGEGQLAPSLASALAHEGHTVELVAADGAQRGQRLLSAARRLGVDTVPARLATSRWTGRESVRRADVVLVVKGRFVPRAVVERLRRGGEAIVVNYFPDNPLFPEFHEPALVDALRAYDAVAIWSEPLAARLRETGVPARMLPFGYDEALYGPGEAVEPRWDVAFVGQWSALRERHVAALEGLRVAVAGSGWAERGDALPSSAAALPGHWFGRRAAALYRESRVGLNVLHPQNEGAHNMRTWELPATGTAAVMTDSAYHRELFAGGGPRLFADLDGLRGAVDELLADDAGRAEAGAAGLRAVRDGTYRARMRDLLGWIEEARR